MIKRHTTIGIRTDDNQTVKAHAPVIISASRATDIPAFYADWFFNRLERGYVKWRNPFNRLHSYVSFANTRFIVFWSKNPAPLLSHLTRLCSTGIGCYIQYTLNDYETERFEPGVPPLIQRIDTFKRLVDKLGFGSVIWRFDPLIISDRISIDNLIDKISFIANQLHGYTQKLVFSYADISSYSKVNKNLTHAGIRYIEWDEESMLNFAGKIANINQQDWGFELATCAEKIDLSKFSICHNQCIDDKLIAQLAWRDNTLMDYLNIEIRDCIPDLFNNYAIPTDNLSLPEHKYLIRKDNRKDTGQRKLCGCILSKDIGQYNTCPHGCLYCYANTSPETAKLNYMSHNHNNEIIC